MLTISNSINFVCQINVQLLFYYIDSIDDFALVKKIYRF